MPRRAYAPARRAFDWPDGCRHALNRPTPLQRKNQCNKQVLHGWLAPKNKNGAKRQRFQKPAAFRATDCNTGSAKLCVKLAF
jgi:hypothetical protein